jgi:hypothetical protein
MLAFDLLQDAEILIPILPFLPRDEVSLVHCFVYNHINASLFMTSAFCFCYLSSCSVNTLCVGNVSSLFKMVIQ